jgi:tetratricopeptide (TPR) repeat protein
MIRHPLGAFTALLALAASTSPGQSAGDSLIYQRWFEARTAHFHLYSCGPTQEVARLAARLEQFREAYSLLAGAQAVASPPIVLMAFPDHEAMQPFLPLRDGRPANLAAFFNRGSDENIIVLHLSDSGSLEMIFHEYTHVLLRHNEPFWPMWLNEGMAEIYATFAVTGGYRARVGQPINHHLHALSESPLLPLKRLFAVTRDSPEYNERQHQGIFYAESWLLAHYLMLGGNAAHKAGFRQLTPLLRQGLSAEQAFTTALRTSLPAMEAELRRYLAQGKFQPLEFMVSTRLDTPRAMGTRGLTPEEVCFRLGDELLHLDRLETAESYFLQAKKIAPASPLPYEGLGLLAVRRQRPEEAVRFFRQAMQRGPVGFLAHYMYAQENYALSAHTPDRYSRLEKEPAAEIRAELQKSLALMPDFGRAHNLLGFFEMVQGEDLAAAEKHLARAIQLEPENQSYLFSLAQVQLARDDRAAARRTLASLRLPYVEAGIRAHAEEMATQIGPRADGQPARD